MGFSRLVSLTVFQSSLFLFVHLIQCLGRIDNASPICHFGCGKEPWPSLLLQRLLGLSLEMRWPAIGQFFFLPSVTVPEVFSKVSLERFPSHF